MSDATTTALLPLYQDEASAPTFLAGHFKSPPENFHNTEKVEVDILRDDEKIAIPIVDLGKGSHENENTLFSNKGFTPPNYSEKITILAWDQVARMPGQSPFEGSDYQANAIVQAFRGARKLERKIRRAVEVQASQVLQTGKLTLTNEAGTQLFVLDFLPKAAHFPDAVAAWSGTSDKIADLNGLAAVLRRNGLGTPKKLLFGAAAWEYFIGDAEVQKRLDNRRMELGLVDTRTQAQDGSVYHGDFKFGAYRLELWGYDGFYRDPVSGLHVPYIGDHNVIMICGNSRLDLSWGGIPQIVRPDQRALPFLPPRISDGARGMDLHFNAFITENNRAVGIEVAARPLCIPTAIDTFGCLNTAGAASS